jgi:hypothetical protein
MQVMNEVKCQDVAGSKDPGQRGGKDAARLLYRELESCSDLDAAGGSALSGTVGALPLQRVRHCHIRMGVR